MTATLPKRKPRRPSPTPRTQPIQVQVLDPDDLIGKEVRAWIERRLDEMGPLPHVPAVDPERERREIREIADSWGQEAKWAEFLAALDAHEAEHPRGQCGHQWPDGVMFTERGSGWVCTRTKGHASPERHWVHDKTLIIARHVEQPTETEGAGDE